MSHCHLGSPNFVSRIDITRRCICCILTYILLGKSLFSSYTGPTCFDVWFSNGSLYSGPEKPTNKSNDEKAGNEEKVTNGTRGPEMWAIFSCWCAADQTPMYPNLGCLFADVAHLRRFTRKLLTFDRHVLWYLALNAYAVPTGNLSRDHINIQISPRSTMQC